MDFTIRLVPGYLRVDIRRRESSDESRAVAEAILTALREHALAKILISVRDSRPVFKVQDYDLAGLLQQVQGLGLRSALVADTLELHGSHQYIELLARQKGLELRAFRDEHTALAWLLAS